MAHVPDTAVSKMGHRSNPQISWWIIVFSIQMGSLMASLSIREKNMVLLVVKESHHLLQVANLDGSLLATCQVMLFTPYQIGGIWCIGWSAMSQYNTNHIHHDNETQHNPSIYPSGYISILSTMANLRCPQPNRCISEKRLDCEYHIHSKTFQVISNPAISKFVPVSKSSLHPDSPIFIVDLV